MVPNKDASQNIQFYSEISAIPHKIMIIFVSRTSIDSNSMVSHSAINDWTKTTLFEDPLYFILGRYYKSRYFFSVLTLLAWVQKEDFFSDLHPILKQPSMTALFKDLVNCSRYTNKNFHAGIINILKNGFTNSRVYKYQRG